MPICNDPEFRSLLAEAVRRCFAVEPGTRRLVTTVERAAMAVGIPAAEMRTHALKWACRRTSRGQLKYDLLARVFGGTEQEVRAELREARAAADQRPCKRCRAVRAVCKRKGWCRPCREATARPGRPTGLGVAPGPRPPPGRPTRHKPGSPGKLAVLETRARAEVGLWHPDDAPYDPGDGPGDVGRWGELAAAVGGRRVRAAVEEPDDEYDPFGD